jgi:hypothetical protein
MMNDLIAKLEFRRARQIKLDKDYQFMLDISNPTAFSVRVLKKKFEGVIIEYTDIEWGDDGRFHFDANVIANPNLKNVESRAFKTFTSDIMRGIITESVRHAEKIINENGTLDSVESIEERTVYAEDDSVSEERVSKRKS